MKLSELASACGGVLEQGEGEAVMTRVSTDSRAICGGELFVALRGERFDAHAFVADVANSGAGAALVHGPVAVPPDFGLVRVDDTLLSLQKLAGAVRAGLRIPVLAVAGSNGKTSTKELCAAALGVRFKCAKTHGNLNNHIGVPLTLLAIDPDHGAAVVEIGTNHPGEIGELCRMVRPDIGILTNIGNEHLEFLIDEAGVAREEGMLLESLERHQLAILNADDPWTERLRSRCVASIVTAGFSEQADVKGEAWGATDGGQQFSVRGVRFELPLAGRHMANNALLAIAAGEALGISLESMAQGLASVRLPGSRMRVVKRGGVTLIDDCYNANPSSMEAALRQLATLSGRRIAVLGTMGELGDGQPEWHRRIGAEAARLEIDRVIAVGSFAPDYLAGAGGGDGFEEIEKAIAFLQSEVRDGDAVLVKASRSARFERIVDGLGFAEEAGRH